MIYNNAYLHIYVSALLSHSSVVIFLFWAFFLLFTVCDGEKPAGGILWLFIYLFQCIGTTSDVVCMNRGHSLANLYNVEIE